MGLTANPRPEWTTPHHPLSEVKRAGARAQQLRVGTTLAEDLSLVPSIIDRRLTTTCNSSSKKQLHIHKYTHTK